MRYDLFRNSILIVSLVLCGGPLSSLAEGPERAPSSTQGPSSLSSSTPLARIFELSASGAHEEALRLLELLLREGELHPALRAHAIEMRATLLKRLQKERPRRGGEGDTEGEARPSARREGTAPAPEARTALTSTTTLLGLSLYGPTLANIPALNSSRLEVGAYTLGASVALAAPLLLYGRDEVSWSMTDLAFTGFTRGGMHGLLLTGALDLDDSFTVLSTMSLSSIAEGSLGLLYAEKGSLGAGETHSLTVGHDLGLASGALLAASFELSERRAMSGLLLSTSLLGFAGGELYHRHRRTARDELHSWGNLELLRLTAALGVYSGGVIGLQFDLEPRELSTLALLSMGGGAWLGDLLTQEGLLSFNEALMIELSTLGGGLLGTGLSYLAFADISSEHLLLGSLAGALGGYALSYRLTERGTSGEGERPPSVSLGPLWIPAQPAHGELRGLSLSGRF